MKIVFVCTGNTCRSPMAEALARKWCSLNVPERGDIRVMSAGLAALAGSPVSSPALEVMKNEGISLTGHRARRFSEELARDSDLILTMSGSHKKTLVKMFPEAAEKIFTLREFAGEGNTDIADPFGQSAAVYWSCAVEIKELIDKIFHKIIKPTQGT
ncbi:MAG: low molecular weight protein arginine phosphatase [Firmicutes bacterium HGW-Firmicutes-14]|nr:MAG: low molecular weight protein arginine phosphatase [Firmicutes bacterium HGW-Firmicutes-14]